MKCNKRLLCRLIDGELSREEEERFKEHLHRCSVCAGGLEELRAHQVLMEDLFVKMEVPPLPLGFKERFEIRLTEEKSGSGVLERLFPLPPRFALAGAGLTVAVVGLLLSLLWLPGQDLSNRREPSNLMLEVISRTDQIQEKQILVDQARKALKKLL